MLTSDQTRLAIGVPAIALALTFQCRYFCDVCSKDQ